LVAACAHAPTTELPEYDRPTQDVNSETQGDPIRRDDPVLDGATNELPGDGHDAAPDPGSGNVDAGPDADTPPPTVNVSWNALPSGFIYRLAVATSTGEWVDSCISVGSATSTVFKGVCPGAGNRAVPNPDAYRLWFSNNASSWTDYVEQPPATAVTFTLPTTPAASIPVSWNRKTTNAAYSLDIVADGVPYGPCINADTIGKNLSYTFTGKCTGTGVTKTVDVSKITEFRIYWAENNQWAGAPSKAVYFNGLGRSVKIPN
jgi:hypothetical protein